MRRIMSVLSGVVAGSMIMFIVETLGHKVYPIAMNLESATKEAKANYMKSLPVEALLMIILAWAVGAFVAGIVSTLISKDSTSFTALRSGGILFALSIFNMIVIPHPIWFWIAGLLVFIPCSWLGFRLIRRKAV
ncbi:MAG TPA: hypothetical protein VK590_09670 [Saprospiraceae bacterium]|nr:hypothetical protein [Saprospiraceae bacterium]